MLPNTNVVMDLITDKVRKVFVDSLSQEDKQFYQKHILEGAPGIIPFLESESIKTLAVLFSDTYRSFLRGEEK